DLAGRSIQTNDRLWQRTTSVGRYSGVACQLVANGGQDRVDDGTRSTAGYEAGLSVSSARQSWWGMLSLVHPISCRGIWRSPRPTKQRLRDRLPLRRRGLWSLGAWTRSRQG